MKTIVISLGGSILIPSLEKNRIREYVPVLGEIAAHHRLFIVVGGGGEARRYIAVSRTLGIDEGTSDEIGILITRLNANLLVAALGEKAYPKVAESHAEAKKFAESGKDRCHGRDNTRARRPMRLQRCLPNAWVHRYLSM